ncbi:MAG: PQQ-dependent sugar dehydrogenase [bacterium]|nr:PQQ-dependent sugar dehydrogenase [bacterium]
MSFSDRFFRRWRISHVRFTLLGAVIATLLLNLTPTQAQAALPAGFGIVQVAGGVAAPTAMAFTPDGRILVTSQFGQVQAYAADGTALGAILTVPTVNPNLAAFDERGLLGIAVDPQFPAQPFIYVYFTNNNGGLGQNRISRYQVDPNTLQVTGAQQLLLEFPVNTTTNHNGGPLAFGPDGLLYAAIGDKQSWNTAPCTALAQDLNSLLGKVLRINPDGTIPASNPFAGPTLGRDEIYAYGLRNPFALAFQPGTGRLHINDVGGGEGSPCPGVPGTPHEEINLGAPGANYAWPLAEGANQGAVGGATAPILIYPHTGPICDSITGGTFYNPPNPTYPADYVNDYYFADYCSGFIRRFEVGGAVAPQDFITNLGFGLVDMKVGPNGDIYYLSRGDFTGQGVGVFRIGYQPTVTQNPQPVTVQSGQPATFTCTATGSQTLAIQWQRNGQNIPNATGATFTLQPATDADNGAIFRCVVTNPFGTATSGDALLTVTPAPVVPPPVVVPPNPPAPGQPVVAQPATQPAGNPAAFDPAISKTGQLPAGSIGLPGERITWTISVSNIGGQPGTNITVVDNVPNALRIESATADRGTATVSGQSVALTIPTLGAGETVRISIVTSIVVSPPDGIISNTATINGTNKSATGTVNVATVLRLPSTGESPLWRRYLVSAIMIVVVGIVALVMVTLAQALTPRRVRKPISKYPTMRW